MKKEKNKILLTDRIPVTPEIHRLLKIYAAENGITLNESIEKLLANAKKNKEMAKNG